MSSTSSGCSGPPLSKRVTSPHAPSSIDRATSSVMRWRSAAVAGRDSNPITTRRTCSEATCAIVLIEMPCCSRRAKYSRERASSRPRDRPDRASLEAVARRGRRAFAGHVERHALPHLALRGAVGHQRHLGVGVEVDEARRDHQAGGINRPAAGRPARGPIAATRSPRMPTSARTAAAPVPSSTSPPVMRTSNGGSCGDVHASIVTRPPTPPELVCA